MSSPRALRVEVVGGDLVVDGRRTLLVAGELHNSGASTTIEIDRAVGAAADLGIDTLLAPVSWDLLEPEEGRFDFTLVDALLRAVRDHGLRWIPLWFGSWKNGMSTYAPRWVAQDTDRFPRLRTGAGAQIDAITPFSENAREADARAFAALLAHLAAHGADVVVMVQVQNEIGMLGDARDHSDDADARWSLPVPESVVAAVSTAGTGRLHDALLASGRTTGTWTELWADEAPEAFMAWAYAEYVESVASVGRRHLDVPLFVNAWLDVDPGGAEVALTGGLRAGDYPSGGPLRHTATIWKALAPSVDLLAPDIYVGDFDRICSEYLAASGALLIPEMRCDVEGVGQMFRAVGEFDAIGVSPFAVDAVPEDDPDRARLIDGFRLLRAVARLRERHSGARTRGFVLTPEIPRLRLDMGGALRIEVDGEHRSETFPADPPGFGILVETEGAWFVIGRGFGVRWLDRDGSAQRIVEADELEVVAEDDVVLRRLNGDERGEWLRMPALDQRQVGAMPIRQNLRLSGVVRVELHSA